MVNKRGKLYYKHGTMGASKTTNMLIVIHKYETQGKKTAIFKSNLDKRNSKNLVSSRLGFEKECLDISGDFDFYDYVENRITLIDIIFIDECQFLTVKQVEQLVQITINFGLNILCYGLKNSYVKGKLFDGVEALLFYANDIEEIKCLCWFCEHKALHNLRIVNGKPIYDGNMIKSGDIEASNDYYLPVCNIHYFNPPLE